MTAGGLILPGGRTGGTGCSGGIGIAIPGIIATLVRLLSIIMKPEANEGGATHATPRSAISDLLARLFMFYLKRITAKRRVTHIYPAANVTRLPDADL
jgi:hypothetical protein